MTEYRLLDPAKLRSQNPNDHLPDESGSFDTFGTPHPWPGWNEGADRALSPSDMAKRAIDLNWWGGLDVDHLVDDWGVDASSSYVLAADFTPVGRGFLNLVEQIAADTDMEPSSAWHLFSEPRTVMRVVPFGDGVIVADASYIQMARSELWAGALLSHVNGWPSLVVTTMYANEGAYFGVRISGAQEVRPDRQGRYSVNGEPELPIRYRATSPGWPQYRAPKIRAILSGDEADPRAQRYDLASLLAAGEVHSGSPSTGTPTSRWKSSVLNLFRRGGSK